MKKSFKLHIFLQLFFLFCLYLYINRTSSQYIAFEFIQDKVSAELAALIEDTHTFSSADVAPKTNFFSHTKFNTLVKCSATSGLTNDLCVQFEDPKIEWSAISSEKPSSIAFAKYLIDKDVWLIIRKQNQLHADYLAVEESEINSILNQTWEIRDYVQIRIYPLMIFLLILVSYYLSSHVISIINKIKIHLSSTDIENINSNELAPTVFKEFQPFVDVFNNLKRRIKVSFDQASRFSAEASHELKTPLTILRGYAERGVKTTNDGSNEQIQFVLMAEEIDRLINITDKLLMLARSDAGRLEIASSLVNLTDIFEQLSLDAEMINPNLRISTNIQKKVAWECDAQLMHQLIYNLYSNAFKYNTLNGWIHFELTLIEDNLTIEIRNSSDNIPRDLSHKAFDRFYRGDESHTRKIEGNGLGLSLCQEIAKIHGGNLTLDVINQHEVSAKFSVSISKPLEQKIVT